MNTWMPCLLGCLAISIGLPARAEPKDTAPPVIQHVAIEGALVDRGLEIRAIIVDEGKVAFPRVYFRRTGEAKYQMATLKVEGREHKAVIPGFVVTEVGLEYYLEAFDAAGNGPTYHGTPEKPHRVVVKKKPPHRAGTTPWYRRWWVWTIAGAVVAGTVTAVAVAATAPDEVRVDVSAPAPRPTVKGL